jgi:hypothetical protein
MHEYIFTRTTLNEAISLCAVKPLDRTLFLHDLLLSHPVTKKIQGSKNEGHCRTSNPKLVQQANPDSGIFSRDATDCVAEKMLESGLKCCTNCGLHIHFFLHCTATTVYQIADFGGMA